MGVDLSSIVERETLHLNELKHKTIAIDGYNTLYQFLSSIRQPDGSPLKDFNGHITSHLSGLFYRTLNLIKIGIEIVYVFDGKPPKFKQREIEERKRKKEEARLKMERAIEEGKEVLTYAQQTSHLTKEMVVEAKELLDGMGIHYVEAPSEGEAEAAYLAKIKRVYASASQDYDSLLFGSPYHIRNLSFSGKRKLPRRNEYVMVYPELIDLNKMLNDLGINQQQLIMLGMLIGTDFNKGVRGIGPKKGLKKVKEMDYKGFKTYIEEHDETFKHVEVDEVFDFFMNPPAKDITLERKKVDKKKIYEILVLKHNFSDNRVEKSINELIEARINNNTKTITDWFK